MTQQGSGRSWNRPPWDQHWARHVDAVWGAQQRRSPGPGGPSGPPAWLAGLFGLGQPEPSRGPRVRRGDVRAAILDVVRASDERGESINGYQVIQAIAERSREEWRPSPGSVYPTIQQLHDEGLVHTDDDHGRTSLRLTDAGRAYVAAEADLLASVWAPFERPDPGRDLPWSELRGEIGQVGSAVWQIVTSGTDRQRSEAMGVLVETRRRLYGILADGAPADGDGAGDPADPDVVDVEVLEDDDLGPDDRRSW